MADELDDRFTHLIAGIDTHRIAVAAVEGAAHDLTASLRSALRDLREAEHRAVGYEAEQVRLEIEMAEFALGKLNRMFETLAALREGHAGQSGSASDSRV